MCSLYKTYILLIYTKAICHMTKNICLFVILYISMWRVKASVYIYIYR